MKYSDLLNIVESTEMYELLDTMNYDVVITSTDEELAEIKKESPQIHKELKIEIQFNLQDKESNKYFKIEDFRTTLTMCVADIKNYVDGRSELHNSQIIYNEVMDHEIEITKDWQSLIGEL